MSLTCNRRIVHRPSPRLAPVTQTIVLFDATARRRANGFGHGLLASRPSHRLDCTIADLEWAAANLNDAGPDYDRLASEAAWQTAYENGHA